MTRSPSPTPGRNRFFDNLWISLTGWLRGTPAGTIRPRALIERRAQRELSLEIPEFPIRDRNRAIQLIEMTAHQPEVGTALKIAVRDIYSSEDGDDAAAIEISPWLDTQQTTPLDTQLYDAASESLARLFRPELLHAIAWRLLAYGDCFGNIALSEGRAKGVASLILLPTWEVFRVEDDKGFLICFEQRRELDDRHPLTLYPGLVTHWRNGCYGLYGRSQFSECLPDWREYKQTLSDLARISHEHAVNPTIFEFDASMGQAAIDAFRHESEDAYRSEDILPRLYLPSSVKVTRMANRDISLDSYLSSLREKRMVFVRASEMPVWMFPGLDGVSGAKDISGQPALAYSRLVNYRRQILSEGIKQVLVTDLALRFGIESDLLTQYKRLRIKWPEFHVRPQDAQTAVEAQIQKQDPQAIDPDPSEAIPLSDRARRRWVNGY